MLEIDKNSYIDIDYADRYLDSYYSENNPIFAHWSVLTDKEKERYLLLSMAQLEKLQFIGKAVNVNQPLQFPRFINTGVCCAHYPIRLVMNNTVPTEVKEAQAENALGIINAEINAVSDKQFMTMQSLGAVKNTKYNKREAGDLGFGEELKSGSSTTVKLSSVKAYELLKNWLNGGFKC